MIGIDNPIFVKEMRSKLLGKKGRGKLIAWSVIPGVLIIIAYSALLLELRQTNPTNAEDFWFFLAFLQLSLIIFLTPDLSAGSITIEKEQRTLEFLIITRLRSDEIILGKLLVVVLSMIFVPVIFLPIMFLCGLKGEIALGLSFAYYTTILICLVAFALIGLFVSTVFQRTVTATVVTYCVILFLIGGPAILEYFHRALFYRFVTPYPSRSESFFFILLNPYYALDSLFKFHQTSYPNLNPYNSPHSLLSWPICLVSYTLFASLLFFVIVKKFERFCLRG